MKTKSLIILITLFTYLDLSAQTEKVKIENSEEYKNSISSNQTGRNELRFNLLTSVIGFPEINYERILATNMSFGLAGAVTFTNREEKSQDYLLGFYRVYFGKKLANGPFIEANLGAVYNKNQIYNGGYIYEDPCPNCYTIYNQYYYEKSSLNLGVGFAIGYKFLSKNGLLGEVFGGLGRNSGEPSRDFYPRVGVSIGKRFGK